MSILFKQLRKSRYNSIVIITNLGMLLGVLLPFKFYGQKVSSSVLNSFGMSIEIQGKTFDASIGELAVSTIGAGGYIITQGFLQPIDLKIPCSDAVLKSYPNPVLSDITIFAEGCDVEVATTKTYDLFGKLVHQGTPINNKINFSSIGVGVYLVRAYNTNDKVIGVVKILKSTI